MEKTLTDQQKVMITQLAASKLFAPDAPPVRIEINMVLAVGLIGQLQLAFRHPSNTGPTREMTENLVRDLIDRIDPEKGDVHQFLMLGFDPNYDEFPVSEIPIDSRAVRCRQCEMMVCPVGPYCPKCDEQICPICGCTDLTPCPDVCMWMPSGICSSCAE